MLHQKEKQILQYLLDNPDQFITSMELAAHLSCSDRTIRNYLKNLMEADPEQTGWAITAKQGYGYQLTISDKEVYQDFLKAEVLLEAAPTSFEGREDRYNYILNKLLFEQQEIFFDDLVGELYVSRSTLSSDFKKIRQDLAKYDLLIESKAKRGVYVKGSERNIRRFIMDYFFRDNFFQVLQHYINIELPGRPIGLEELTIIVLDECREGQLRLSDFAIQNLVIHIALSLKRIGEGFHINRLDSWNCSGCVRERQIAQKILERVHLATGMVFPAEEVDYITLHLISKASLQQVSSQEESDVAEQLRSQLTAALEEQERFGGQPFASDFQLVEGLLAHLSTLLIRLKNHVKMTNPLLADIREHDAGVLEMTRAILTAMPLFSKQEGLSEDEIAYVALHFMAALERLREKQKFNILIICATGYGSAQMLRNRIANELGNLVHIVDVIGYYELNDERLQHIDFIISSIDLSNLLFSLPVFTVSIFLKADEVRDIKHKIACLKPISGCEIDRQPPQSSAELEKLFDDYFSEACFAVYEQTDKEAVLTDLLGRMAVGEGPDFPGRICSLMEQRERMSSIIFSDSIAVPHPIQACAKRHRIAAALIPSGLAWSQNHPHIRLVFLVSPSIYGNNGMAQLTAKIVDLLEQPDLEDQIVNCKNFAAFKELFLSI
ncbi:BglG family transcription antiterminator [Streptococcus panodentis]|uniref:Transcription antiterminator BglG n=1 Tax=Streptococcus panodentis TaxID=1581472 RepID=A0ABS5AUE4_9STRE|nr:transcription antiterminator BglG [Streptococcus panodentis]